MGKPKWWICDECRSLNDLPANKCYNCHATKPDQPTLMDDMYAEVGGSQKRVGVSVDRSRIGELSTADPVATSTPGSSLLDADFVVPPGQAGRHDTTWEGVTTSADLSAEQAIAPVPGRPVVRDASQPLPPPLREPLARSISAVGGRPWSDDPNAAPPPPQGQVPTPHGQAPPQGQVPPPGRPMPVGPTQPPPGPPMPPGQARPPGPPAGRSMPPGPPPVPPPPGMAQGPWPPGSMPPGTPAGAPFQGVPPGVPGSPPGAMPPGPPPGQPMPPGQPVPPPVPPSQPGPPARPPDAPTQQDDDQA